MKSLVLSHRATRGELGLEPGLLLTRSQLASLPLGQCGARPVFLKLKSGLLGILLKIRACVAMAPASAPAGPGLAAFPSPFAVKAPSVLQLPGELWLLPSHHPRRRLCSSSHLPPGLQAA